MKILLVNDYKENVGGTESYVTGLKKELIRLNHKVKTFTGDTSHKQSTKSKSPIQLLSLLFSLKYLYKFWKEISVFKPDIILVNNIFYEISPSFILLTKKIPVIMIIHDNQIYSPVALQNLRTGKYCKRDICEGCTNCMGFFKSRLELFKRKIHGVLLKNIDIYIGNSKYTNSILKKKFKNVVEIKFGASLFTYSEISNFNTITYVGRLVKEKGIQNLIMAMPKVICQFPKTKLLIVGDGDYKLELQSLISKLNLQKKIFIKKTVSHKEVEKYYSNTTIVVIPSIWKEPFCLVGIEAMSVGRPIVATKLGGITDWLEDGKTGLFVDSGKIDQLEEKIVYLLSDRKLLKLMSEQSRKKAEEFSIKSHVERLERICNKLVNNYC